MIRLLRVFGFLLMVAGVVVLASYLIPPLRYVWPWFRQLPWAIQVGLGVAALGLVVLFASLLVERWQDRAEDPSSKEEI